MGNQKRVADGDGDGECPLPPELVQHIQSLMDRKEAARSTILSKSWYNFWSKRPILDFDQRDFRHLGVPYFCSEIMRKYDRGDNFYLKIQTYVFSIYPLLLLLKFSGRLEYEFHKLESLSLDNLRVIDTLFFQDLCSKFPCLRNLKLRYVYDCKNIRIRSQSLENISVVEYNRAVTMEFDVPNLRKFHFVGCALSCLAFGAACSSRDWESDIGIMCYQASASWLSSLRKLLTNFSLSKVSLSIHVKFPSMYVCDYTTTANEHVPGVENLNFLHHAPNAGLLDGLLMICRPKLCVVPGNYDLLELLCKKFENKCVRGLEDVNVECFEESLAEWQPVPLKSVLDASTDPENAQAFRFRLRWGMETCAL